MNNNINNLVIARALTATILSANIALSAAKIESDIGFSESENRIESESENIIETNQNLETISENETIVASNEEKFDNKKESKKELTPEDYYVGPEFIGPITVSENEVVEVEETREYSGMALSHEYEDFIIEKSEQYGVPYQAMLCLGNVETGTTWNCNGINGNGNLGQFQINCCHLSLIRNQFGWGNNNNETMQLLLNDDEKNAEAAIFLFGLILNDGYCNGLEDAFGMYNNYIYWKSTPHSINYVNVCMGYMNTYFSEDINDVRKMVADYKANQLLIAQIEKEEKEKIEARKLYKKNVKMIV